MPDSIEDELKRVEQLRDDCRYVEALVLIEKIEEIKTLTKEDRLWCLILKGEILGFDTQISEALELGKEAYELSQKLGNDEAIIDSLFNMATLIYQGQVEEGFKILTQIENLIKNIKNVSLKKINYWNWKLNQFKAYGSFTQGKVDKTLEYGRKGLKFAKIVRTKSSLAHTIDCIGLAFLAKNDIDKGMLNLNKSLKIYEEAKNLRQLSNIYSQIGMIFYFLGQFNQALTYLERSSAIKESHELIKLNTFTNMGSIFTEKGELDRGLDYLKKALTLTETEKTLHKTAHSLLLLGIGRNLKSQGDFDGAIKYFERCLEVSEELGNSRIIENSVFRLLTIYLEKGDDKKAKFYLNCLKENIKEGDDGYNSSYFLLGKALMLKTSKRISDIAEAEKILKEFIQADPGIGKDDKFALILLSEILLEELQMTNNLEVLNEINPLLDKLQFIAEKQHSYRYLAETNLLRAKLALIQNKTDEAQRLLSEAQRTADWHGLNYLAQKISSEHDKLLEQIDMWEKINRTNVPISERIKLASFDNVMDRLQEKRAVESPKMETEQPLLLAILSKTGYLMFSIPFTAEMTFNEQQLGSFISTLSSSSNQLFSEAIDRIKIGDYMVLLKKVEDFSICYVFRGESYSAGQKLQNFTEAVKENKTIIDLLNTTIRTGHQINLNENPDLEELITSSFMADPKKFKLPFQAYKGDDPFLFVSYAHSDKLQVYPIMDYLNKSGFNVWYDEGISVSEEWIESIVENINRCTAFLVFITPHIIDSEFVNKEINYALSKKKPFYSVYLKDTKLPDKLQFQIAGIQSMKKYTMPDGEFYDKITEILSPILKKR
jgi:tetratricopeptide (TPR) repeat protein